MMRRGAGSARLTAALIAVALARPSVAPAQKADTVTLINGDRITGEIKEVNRGKLTYDTDDAGQLGIKWPKVVRLVSKRTFEVTDRSGRRHIGVLRESAGDGLLVIGDAASDTVRILDAVTMTELGAHFLQRVSGAVDVGYTYTATNKATTLSASGDVAYRGRDFGSSLQYETYQQKQESGVGVSRWSATATGSRYLKRNLWSLETVIAVQRNDELNLVRRLLGGAGLGWAVHRSNFDDVQLILGTVAIQERFSVDTAPDVERASMEGAFIVKADVFRFDKPKLSATTELWSFKSFSTAGRFRGDAGLDVKYTGMQDFSVGVQLKDVFDTHPPSAAAKKNDFQVTFTFGWLYRR